MDPNSQWFRTKSNLVSFLLLNFNLTCKKDCQSQAKVFLPAKDTIKKKKKKKERKELSLNDSKTILKPSEVRNIHHIHL